MCLCDFVWDPLSFSGGRVGGGGQEQKLTFTDKRLQSCSCVPNGPNHASPRTGDTDKHTLGRNCVFSNGENSRYSSYLDSQSVSVSHNKRVQSSSLKGCSCLLLRCRLHTPPHRSFIYSSTKQVALGADLL